MIYADRADLRRDYYVVAQNRAMPRNLPVLKELLDKRHELATLLGFASWADYVTEDKMIGSGKAAREFVERVLSLATERARAEYAELLELKRETEPGAHAVYEWEHGYLVEKKKRQRFAFDSQAVRPYFAYSKVKDGVLSTSASLYGVEFRRNTDVEPWHPSVECFDVLDGGEVVARFHLDMHPRANKFKHAAMFDMASGLGGKRIPEACLVCNFPEPKAGDPALLLHDQVTTFFHEFGHLLHHLFGGGQRYLRFSGIATEWDFVEVPSQMYEEWAWDAGVLARFATDANGKSIPEELVRRMRTAEEYGKGLATIRQMYFARLSLSYYERDPAGLDTTEQMIRLKQRITPFPHTEGTYLQASFGHLHGYSAMYYTYMWSLVIAKDLFSRFDGDLMNTATANDYRESVLAPGGSRDAVELVREFLGRDYGFSAFESWLAR
jgi:thimet oligopeptidase